MLEQKYIRNKNNLSGIRNSAEGTNRKLNIAKQYISKLEVRSVKTIETAVNREK